MNPDERARDGGYLLLKGDGGGDMAKSTHVLSALGDEVRILVVPNKFDRRSILGNVNVSIEKLVEERIRVFPFDGDSPGFLVVHVALDVVCKDLVLAVVVDLAGQKDQGIIHVAEGEHQQLAAGLELEEFAVMLVVG